MTILAIGAVLAAATVCPGQTSITLRPSAELAAGAQDVRLADIADLAGPEAEALGSVVVRPVASPGRDGTSRVDLAAVRAALDAGTAGGVAVNWGRVTLRGASCMVRVGEPPKATSRGEPALPKQRADDSTLRPIDMTGEATVRTAIAARVAVAYGVSVDRLRLGFDAGDREVLATVLGERRVDIDLAGSPGSARLPVTVTLYAGDRIELSRTIQADVRVRHSAVKAAMGLERGHVIVAEDLVAEDRWGPPTRAKSPSVKDLIGQVTSKRIAAGEELGRDDFAAAMACKRGDTVFVHCLSGSVVLKLRARAMGAARDGELVELKREGAARDEKPFTARMSGRGRAVMDAGR